MIPTSLIKSLINVNSFVQLTSAIVCAVAHQEYTSDYFVFMRNLCAQILKRISNHVKS
jgi:hypothetical protein